jgi:flavin-binding protein dodecin
MEHNVYKHIQVTGTSGNSPDEAIRNAIARASKTIHNMRWFEVVETRGHIEGDQVSQWQITMRIGFTLD